MRKLLTISVLALSVATANAADQRHPGFYVRGDVGATILSDSTLRASKEFFDNLGFTGGVGVGYRFNEMLRVELDGSYKKLTLPTPIQAGAYQYTAMVNGFVDFNTSTVFTPYVTAGLGYANTQNEFLKGAFSGHNFVWNVGAGSRVQLTRNVDLDVGYRYVNNASDVKTHEATLGMVYHF